MADPTKPGWLSRFLSREQPVSLRTPFAGPDDPPAVRIPARAPSDATAARPSAPVRRPAAPLRLPPTQRPSAFAPASTETRRQRPIGTVDDPRPHPTIGAVDVNAESRREPITGPVFRPGDEGDPAVYGDMRDILSQHSEGMSLFDFLPVTWAARAAVRGARAMDEGRPGAAVLEAGLLALPFGVEQGVKKLGSTLLLRELQMPGGATLTGRGRRFSGTGYAVADPALTTSFSTAEEAQAFLARPEVQQALAEGRHLGKWTDPISGVTEVNITDIIPDSKAAQRLAAQRGEQAIGHLENGEYLGDIANPHAPVPEARLLVQRMNAQPLMPRITEVPKEHGEYFARTYEQLPADEAGAKDAYDALNREVEAQMQAIEDAGYRIEYVDTDPYKTSAEMMADVRENRTLKVFRTPREGAFHPYMTPEQNDRFRAVHDFLAHAGGGNQFGVVGEENAYRIHASTLSREAQRALASETRGQNSWVNFGPNSSLPVGQRPFAEQKAALWPPDLLGDYGEIKLGDEAQGLLGDIAETGFAGQVGDVPVPPVALVGPGELRPNALSPVDPRAVRPPPPPNRTVVGGEQAGLLAEQMAETGFAMPKGPTDVLLPTQGAGRGGSTVEAVRAARAKVGDAEFQRLVQEEIARRPAGDPVMTEGAAVEEVARRIASEPAPPERIVGTVTKYGGKEYDGTVHAEGINAARAEAEAAGMPFSYSLVDDEYFRTSTGRVVRRDEALELAKAADQWTGMKRLKLEPSGRPGLMAEALKDVERQQLAEIEADRAARAAADPEYAAGRAAAAPLRPPGTVYHGTAEDFARFSNDDFPHWFAEDRAFAADHADKRGGSRVIEARLGDRRAFDARGYDASADARVQDFLDDVNAVNGTDITAAEIGFDPDYEGFVHEWVNEPGFANALRKRGYGLIGIEDTAGPGANKMSWGVLDREAIEMLPPNVSPASGAALSSPQRAIEGMNRKYTWAGPDGRPVEWNVSLQKDGTIYVDSISDGMSDVDNLTSDGFAGRVGAARMKQMARYIEDDLRRAYGDRAVKKWQGWRDTGARPSHMMTTPLTDGSMGAAAPGAAMAGMPQQEGESDEDYARRRLLGTALAGLGAFASTRNWRPTERGVFDRSAPKIQGTAPIDPRMASAMPRGEASELAQAIANSKVVARGLADDIAKGLPEGGLDWYEGGPIKAYLDELGGPVSFDHFNLARGSGSIQNPTHNEIATASGLLFGERQGLESAAEIAAAHKSMYPREPGLYLSENTLANFRRAREAGAQLPATPGSAERKVPWYSQGNAGGSADAMPALDTHERRRILQLAAADRKVKKLLKELGITNVSGPRADPVPIKNAKDYDVLGSMYQRAAREMGLPTTQAAQAGRWIGGAPHTGLYSQPRGDFVQTLEDVLLHTARARGQSTDPASLQKLFNRISQGEDIGLPLYGKNPLGHLHDGQGLLF